MTPFINMSSIIAPKLDDINDSMSLNETLSISSAGQGILEVAAGRQMSCELYHSSGPSTAMFLGTQGLR